MAVISQQVLCPGTNLLTFKSCYAQIEAKLGHTDMLLESDVSNETKHLAMCQWCQEVLDFLFWNYRRFLRSSKTTICR